MGCLFCDQTPESCDAREKLAEVASLLGCEIHNVVLAVQHIVQNHAFAKECAETLRAERNRWRDEVTRLQTIISGPTRAI